MFHSPDRFRYTHISAYKRKPKAFATTFKYQVTRKKYFLSKWLLDFVDAVFNVSHIHTYDILFITSYTMYAYMYMFVCTCYQKLPGKTHYNLCYWIQYSIAIVTYQSRGIIIIFTLYTIIIRVWYLSSIWRLQITKIFKYWFRWCFWKLLFCFHVSFVFVFFQVVTA